MIEKGKDTKMNIEIRSVNPAKVAHAINPITGQEDAGELQGQCLLGYTLNRNYLRVCLQRIRKIQKYVDYLAKISKEFRDSQEGQKGHLFFNLIQVGDI